jgi:hypothetical protein
MERPSTSKSRGICRYYTTPRGCFAGKNCKFLHGEGEKLTSYDLNKTCKFYRAGTPTGSSLILYLLLISSQGYCRRGADCWFRHVDESRQSEPASLHTPDEDLHCNICYEKPTTYALLSTCLYGSIVDEHANHNIGGCSHVFCLQVCDVSSLHLVITVFISLLSASDSGVNHSAGTKTSAPKQQNRVHTAVFLQEPSPLPVNFSLKVIHARQKL